MRRIDPLQTSRAIMQLLRSEFSRYFAAGFAVAAALVLTLGQTDRTHHPITDTVVPAAQAAELH